jgi:CBS domain-containing protein
MTCREVMCANPQFCLPEDNVRRAADIMKREDVGPVPVVYSQSDRRVVGIITDRDLAIRIIAEGKPPDTARVSDVMTPNPVTCRADDDIHEPLRVMSREQIRRIPIVDSNNQLCGIVAQADIARHLDEREAGELVEDISQPGHSSVGRAFRRTGQAVQHWAGQQSRTGGGLLLTAGIAAAAGAALMAVLDQRRYGTARLDRQPDSRDFDRREQRVRRGADEIGSIGL